MHLDSANDENPPGISESGKRVASAVQDWLRGISELATLEIRYSIKSITTALIATFVFGAVVFASWCMILGVIVLYMVQSGWGWIPAVLFVLMLNAIFAVFLWNSIQALIARVGMDETRCALGFSKTTQNDKSVQTNTGE